MAKHKWVMCDYDPTQIDVFAGVNAGYHNGPRCTACGFQDCHHCYPEMYDEECPR